VLAKVGGPTLVLDQQGLQLNAASWINACIFWLTCRCLTRHLKVEVQRCVLCK
jgi:hypothetical protein